ncbi:hypothetical protein JD974_01545 [Chromobacterium haemolyticum]|uniref:DUF1484 domain-containing protein n=1 Tax=Chromobacterium haemolyticum TaxID=394935 RepID=A0ABS3GGK7_9NEIS|nr:hypothetical protein [Chromobacterium haemolyticum]MBK0413079.1 hypothetical protein [Chromobacterium haemolyticum]MBO0414181.1 hypothetical protein [Chromobacterium haemolyticum]MBO0497441.1 hypothetical protein [Chromobacterium haemolyticum]
MNAPIAKPELSPLQRLHEQIKQLRIVTAGQDETYALVKLMEQRYLQADESLTQGIVHVHASNQSLHALMALLQDSQEDKHVNCQQMAALLEPIRQELQAGFEQISDVI